jgi:hypothetical protein
MKTAIKLLPCFGAFAWLMWFCVQAKWGEVIVPNIGWLVLVAGIGSAVVWWLTREKKSKSLTVLPEGKNIVPQERLIAKEVYTWRTVTRERSIYAKPK